MGKKEVKYFGFIFWIHYEIYFTFYFIVYCNNLANNIRKESTNILISDSLRWSGSPRPNVPSDTGWPARQIKESRILRIFQF